MKFFIVKFFLGFTGLFFFIIFIVSLYNLIQTIYFSEEKIIEHLFNSNPKCEKSNVQIETKLCQDIATSYWMLMIGIISSILSFIVLFPFFIIKKKKNIS